MNVNLFWVRRPYKELVEHLTEAGFKVAVNSAGSLIGVVARL